MPDAIIPATARSEFTTRERCHITELLNDPRAPQVSLARCRVEAGVTTELHALSVDEVYVIDAGRGAVELGGAPPFDVSAGDAVQIPAGVSQRIRNTGSGDLVFQCLCTPRFTQAAYRPLEDP